MVLNSADALGLDVSSNPICATSSGRSGFVLGEPEAAAATSDAGPGLPGHEGEAAA